MTDSTNRPDPGGAASGRDRIPYVGEGEDGARRSARIDREEADGHSVFSDAYDRAMDSAQAWDDQATALMLERLGPRPSLEQIAGSDQVGSEDWLAGLALIQLSPVLAADAARWTSWSTSDGRYVETYQGGDDLVRTFDPTPVMDWDGWAQDVDDVGRGWSSTEWRLFQLVAGITVLDRTASLAKAVNLGSWEQPALAIVVEWASGGNQRDRPGRYTVTPQQQRQHR